MPPMRDRDSIRRVGQTCRPDGTIISIASATHESFDSHYGLNPSTTPDRTNLDLRHREMVSVILVLDGSQQVYQNDETLLSPSLPQLY